MASLDEPRRGTSLLSGACVTRLTPARRLRFATALGAWAAALGAFQAQVAAAEQPIDHGVAPLGEYYDEGLAAYDEPAAAPAEAPPVDESLFDEPSVDKPLADETPLGNGYADELMLDPQPLPMAAGDETYSASAFGDGNSATVLPVSWISGPYFKAGVNALSAMTCSRAAIRQATRSAAATASRSRPPWAAIACSSTWAYRTSRPSARPRAAPQAGKFLRAAP